MRACSLLVIPPPKEREPPPGGFPKDLSDLNLLSWAGLVQDVTSSLLAPPPNLGSDVSLLAVALLELLEKTTGWGYCRFCYHLGSRCTCTGAYSPAPPLSWSQVVGESPGCRATASSGGMTAPSIPAAGMSGYVPPPPGLPPIDFSKWRLPPPEAPASRGPTAPPNLPGVRRSDWLRGTAQRITGVPYPGGLAQWMPVPPTSMPCTPQMAPPLQQPCLEWPAMPYQQVVHPPKKPAGRGVAADAPTNKTASVGDVPDHGRPSMRGQGGSSQSVSHPRGVPGKASAQPLHQEGDLPSGLMPSVPPPPPAPERTQTQWGGWPRSALRDTMRLAANFCSSGWRKDLEHILQVYYRFSVASFREAEWVRVKERFFDHFLQHKGEALALKEAHSMDFMAYVQDLFYQATGLHLDGLASFTGWIKRGSYYHGLVAQQGHLHECLHLTGAPLPRWPQVSPSESHRESQMKLDAQTHSSSRPSVGATVAPITETPVAETPVAETPVAEALWQRLLLWRLPLWRFLLRRPRVLKLRLPPPPHLFPWRQAEWVMANHGQSKWRPVKRRPFRGAGQLNMPSPNPGGVSQNPGFPSPSRTVRGGSPLSHSCMSMQPCNQPPHTMWQVRQLCIYTPICCRKRPLTLETRLPA